MWPFLTSTAATVRSSTTVFHSYRSGQPPDSAASGGHAQLEVIRCRMTTDVAGVYRGPAHAAATIVRSGGARALYRGLGPSLAAIAPEAAITYGAGVRAVCEAVLMFRCGACCAEAGPCGSVVVAPHLCGTLGRCKLCLPSSWLCLLAQALFAATSAMPFLARTAENSGSLTSFASVCQGRCSRR